MTELGSEQRALLSLTMVSGLGPRLIHALMTHFGSAEEVLDAPPERLAQVPHISERSAKQFRTALDSMDVDREIQQIQEHRVQLTFAGDDNYPKPLMTLTPPPPMLYFRGTLVTADEKAIAVVGSRTCTSYGIRTAERLAHDLAQAGWTIISGLARGIDAAAHRGALKAKGRTLSVLANGLSRIYPPEHADLACQVEQSGAILTEFPMHMSPIGELFIARNRIISGLSKAVIVVEADHRSGALSTARLAGEQGREVFAVPGPVDSAASNGTHDLIRNGARLIRNVDDILEDLKGITPASFHSAGVSASANGEPPPTKSAAAEQTIPELDDKQRKLWEFLADGPKHQDNMLQELGFTVPELSGMLLMLEIKKVIRRLPGNRFERY